MRHKYASMFMLVRKRQPEGANSDFFKLDILNIKGGAEKKMKTEEHLRKKNTLRSLSDARATRFLFDPSMKPICHIHKVSRLLKEADFTHFRPAPSLYANAVFICWFSRRFIFQSLHHSSHLTVPTLNRSDEQGKI